MCCWDSSNLRNLLACPYYIQQGFLDARIVCKTSSFPAEFSSFMELIHQGTVSKPLAGTHMAMFVNVSRPRSFRGSSEIFFAE